MWVSVVVHGADGEVKLFGFSVVILGDTLGFVQEFFQDKLDLLGQDTCLDEDHSLWHKDLVFINFAPHVLVLHNHHSLL